MRNEFFRGEHELAGESWALDFGAFGWMVLYRAITLYFSSILRSERCHSTHLA